ncbi:hypothetical protein PHYBOEH_007703 [Phytophthora boehmeriae]|uniref:FYVE-type domain-containing protein n=1 Tax=Phytophthora boehmeriae TaxID=109152 RepID=A0A8T1W994_9STRA|nr:hypothetical protein PHYBOEH_007703 [Phytophthora boehmeriae]
MQERGNSEAIRLAQASDWKGLQRLLERKPAVAKERGDHGMLPIHWVCTVRRVPLTLVSKLLQAYPDGVKAKNAGELLPLHIAIRAHVHASILRKLVRAYPDAVNEHTPDGVSALELAEQVALDAESLKVLYRALDRNSLVQQQPDDDGNNSFSRENVDFNYDISNNDDSISQEKGQDSGVETPENKDDENDENWGTPLESTPKPFVGNAVFGEEYFHHSVENDDFDAAKLASFGVFKHRHHCRNCGKSICSQHSADKKLIMEDKGFTTPQRVCVTCYAMITHSRSLRHDLEIDDYGREGATAAPAAFQQQYYGGGNGEQHAFASRTRSVRSPARPERGSQAGSPTPSTGTARNVNSRKSSLVAAGEATGGAGERATTANHASGIPAVSGGQAATVQELRCLLASQQKQIEQLAQSNMQMQQQLIEQEELKAETMLLITQLMTRVSVLELHKDNSLRTTKRRSVGTGDSEDDEEYPQDDTTAFMR